MDIFATMWQPTYEPSKKVINKQYTWIQENYTSGSTPGVLLDGKWESIPSEDLSTVVKHILYSCENNTSIFTNIDAY